MQVTTSDGYILSVQRIPSGHGATTGKIPVLLQHGLMMVLLALSLHSTRAFQSCADRMKMQPA